MKALITGATGFVGPYLRTELSEHGYIVIGTDLSGNTDYKLDITDAKAVNDLLAETKPDLVFHLAGFSSVKKSFENPDLCMHINVGGTKNVMLAAQKNIPNAKLLIISSSEVYGNPAEVPAKESTAFNPRSPYAESRVAQEAILEDFDTNWVVSRSFNHIGPGQQLGFVSSDFASQIANINKHSEVDAKILVGNLEAIRDFSDVRDVVHAYRLLAEQAQRHEIYNVCSGKGISIKELLDILLNLSERKIEVVNDPKLARPSDIAKIIGDNSKLKKATGWGARYDLTQTLAQIYQSWLSTSD